MPIIDPQNRLAMFANAVMDMAEANDLTNGMTNEVENPTEFICWVGPDDDYITARVTFEVLDVREA